MSKISDRKIFIPNDVSLTQKDGLINIVGPEGTVSKEIPLDILISFNSDEKGNKFLNTSYNGDNRSKKKRFCLVGTINSILSSLIAGSLKKYEKELEIKGAGYKVLFDQNNKKLVFSLGFSHNKTLDIPDDIFIINRSSILIIKCIDKQRLGWFCSLIKSLRKTTPYKIKGIYDNNEVIKLKSGKKAK